MKSMVSTGCLLLALAACPPPATNPGPYGPQPQPQQPQPQPPAEDEVPIDPSQPMPEQSYSTSATLQPGAPATVMVDGRADIFSAGLPAPDPKRGGQPNAVLTLAPGGGAISISNVKGLVGCKGAVAAGADGGSCAGGKTNLQSASGISGVVHHGRTQFLVGVFLADAPPPQAPPILDFSDGGIGTEFAELSPQLGQTFFIGDGVTSTGAAQRFVIPAGATRLHLGFADGWSFQGAPGFYKDNAGGLRVTVLQQP